MATHEPLSESTTEATEAGSGSAGELSQWRLMGRRFRQSKLAVGGGIILLIMYAVSFLAPFFAINDPAQINNNLANASPSKIVWSDGGLAICGVSQKLNQDILEYEYVTDCSKKQKIELFTEGYEYSILGISSDKHLIGTSGKAKFFLWGADTSGRDVFSRTLEGGRVSLTIGLVGVAISTILAALIGTASGYFAGKIDNIVQRVIEVILSVPTLPLWATMAAVLPRDMSVEKRYFFISLILSLVVWANVARQVRGKVMAYAASDYVGACRAAGGSHFRVIWNHLLPNSLSHIIVVAMLAIPTTIIAETSLSFLGIGMLEPAISWGVLLQEAQQIQVIMDYPWMLIPAAAVIVAITCFQLVGDGVRDAVDPYG